MLSIFLGGVGIDMFYLGYNFRGLVKCLLPLSSFLIILSISEKKPIKNLPISYYLFLFPLALFFLIWFIDIVLILSLPYDSRGFILV